MRPKRISYLVIGGGDPLAKHGSTASLPAAASTYGQPEVFVSRCRSRLGRTSKVPPVVVEQGTRKRYEMCGIGTRRTHGFLFVFRKETEPEKERSGSGGRCDPSFFCRGRTWDTHFLPRRCGRNFSTAWHDELNDICALLSLVCAHTGTLIIVLMRITGFSNSPTTTAISSLIMLSSSSRLAK